MLYAFWRDIYWPPNVLKCRKNGHAFFCICSLTSCSVFYGWPGVCTTHVWPIACFRKGGRWLCMCFYMSAIGGWDGEWACWRTVWHEAVARWLPVTDLEHVCGEGSMTPWLLASFSAPPYITDNSAALKAAAPPAPNPANTPSHLGLGCDACV